MKKILILLIAIFFANGKAIAEERTLSEKNLDAVKAGDYITTSVRNIKRNRVD